MFTRGLIFSFIFLYVKTPVHPCTGAPRNEGSMWPVMLFDESHQGVGGVGGG